MDNFRIKTALIDGYLDEPSCLGVPPYISPHIRYTYGSLLAAGIREENLTYFTIDSLRQDWEKKLQELESYDLVIVIAGTTVPGHYLGGQPISLKEIREMAQKLYYPQKVLGGPITLVFQEMEGYDYVCQEICALDLYQKLTGKEVKTDEIASQLSRWAVRGAALTKKHPNYPYLVCEIETFRGCPRQKHCAFCSERLKKRTYQRQPQEILQEIKALAEAGNQFFRLGCQTDLFLYQALPKENGDFILNPGAIEELYAGIRELVPELKVLHLDNINPVNIVKYGKASLKILETIVKYNTAGDVAAFGLESADPQVLKRNQIEAEPEITYQAVEILNQIGGRREDGLPKLLPGLNLLHGLIGERPATMSYNYQFLKRIYEAGLMVRRINIRQVVSTGKYPVQKIKTGAFKQYKQQINQEINQPMLRRVFPPGTILKNVLTEKIKGRFTYGRQLGSYPILVAIPGQLPLKHFLDVIVVDHGYRSLTALPWPFDFNRASLEELTAIPGIGRKRASRLMLEQPKSIEELRSILGPDFPLAKWSQLFRLHQ